MAWAVIGLAKFGLLPAAIVVGDRPRFRSNFGHFGAHHLAVSVGPAPCRPDSHAIDPHGRIAEGLEFVANLLEFLGHRLNSHSWPPRGPVLLAGLGKFANGFQHGYSPIGSEYARIGNVTEANAAQP